jgi:aspartate/glutamate racemase
MPYKDNDDNNNNNNNNIIMCTNTSHIKYKKCQNLVRILSKFTY